MKNRKRNFAKPTFNPDLKNVNLFEIDGCDVAVAAPVFVVVVDSEHDEDEDSDIM